MRKQDIGESPYLTIFEQKTSNAHLIPKLHKNQDDFLVFWYESNILNQFEDHMVGFVKIYLN